MSLRCELSSNQLGNTTESWEEYRVIVRTSFETKCQILSSAKFASSDPRAEEIAKVSHYTVFNSMSLAVDKVRCRWC